MTFHSWSVPKTKICYTPHVLTLDSSTKIFCMIEAYQVETSKQLFQETKNSEALKTIPRYQSLLLITILVRFFFTIRMWKKKKNIFLNSSIYKETSHSNIIHFFWIPTFRVMVFNANFNNISVISWPVSFIGGGNRSTWRKPPTCRKSLTNFIT